MKSEVQAVNLIEKIESFHFLCSIHVWHDILVNLASKMMQNPTYNVGKIIENLNNIILRLKEFRSDEYFEKNIIRIWQLKWQIVLIIN